MIHFNKTTTNLSTGEKNRIIKAIERQPINGPYVSKLEKYFRSKFKVKYAIACANATTGLIIAIRACGFYKKKVSLPAFTWYSTLWAVQCNGCKPLFSDIDKDTWIMDHVYDNSDFVLAVDTFGNKADIKTDKPVIYDAAHGFGISGLGKRGIAEVVSFSFTKVVPAMQGGIILTDNEEIYKKSHSAVKAFGKMCDVNAIVALNSIKKYYKEKRIRENIINFYRSNIELPFVEQQITETNHSVYSILFQSKEIRDRVVNDFIANGIEPKVYYVPLRSGLKNTDDIYSRILSLPLYSSLQKPVLEKICKIINKK